MYAPHAPPAASVRTITMKFSISFIFRPRHSVWKPDDAGPVESSISLRGLHVRSNVPRRSDGFLLFCRSLI
ncbi:hypothetical protein GGD52_003267 [Agrobacterium tumefaciens]|nr:hypothetical protein [Agrobacterium radiobacter]MBB5588663.1 hypothetical protein [Agrobacterium radiobacter]